MARYSMVIDLKKCIGCHACTIACKAKNSTRPGIFWNWVFDEEVGEYPSVNRYFVPRLCMHCQDAPCIEVCPTGATYRGEDGLVLIDYDKCAGCRYCVVACPYGARYFNEQKAGYFGIHLIPPEELGYQKRRLGAVEKCDFCIDAVKHGQDPACVRACPNKARCFGNLDDPDSEVSKLIRSKHGFQLHKELGTDPLVYYLPQ